MRDQQLLEGHGFFIQQHHNRPDSPSGQDDSTLRSQGSEELLVTLRMAQVSMTKQLEKKNMSREAIRNRMLKSKSLVIVAKQIQASYVGELGLSDAAKGQVRGVLQKWRDVVAETLSEIDETLGSW